LTVNKKTVKIIIMDFLKRYQTKPENKGLLGCYEEWEICYIIPINYKYE